LRRVLFRYRKYVSLLLIGILVMMPSGVKTAAETDTETIYEETFDDGVGVATQAGDADLTVEDKQFPGNDNEKAVYVSNRSENYDGMDIHFSDVGMEDGKTYNVTVTGYIDEDVDVPEDAQALMQNIDSYEGFYIDADYTAGETFTLSGTYTVDTDEDRAIRIQSNDAGEDIPFYIGNIVIRKMEDEEEPRDPAQSFTMIDFEDGDLNGFEARGDQEKLTVTDEANHSEGGEYALKIEDREHDWNGPTLNVTPYVDIGQEYNVSVWVKLIEPSSAELKLTTQIGSTDYGATYYNIEEKTINTDDGWVQFGGTYRYNSVGDENVSIFVESSDEETASFYIDDVMFEPTNTEEIDIERDLRSIKEVYEDDFLIGSAIMSSDLAGKRLDLLKMHHNLVTAGNEMKPGYVYNDDGEFDFTAQDALVDKIRSEGFDLHGHVLLWHQQSNESLYIDEKTGEPLSREEALENLRTHVKTVVEHFGDQVISWDVVNEAMNDNPPYPEDWEGSLRESGWFKAIGPDYIEEAFRTAKEVIDENGWDIKLYYNDYNDDNQNKAEAIYQMVKEINERYGAENDGALLVDGIGMQGHYSINTNPDNVKRSLEKFISLGVEVGVTELDVTAGSDNELTESEANKQAYLYAKLFQLYKEHAEHISRITFWGINDALSWRAAQSPLLFDKDNQAKLAYYAVVDPDTFIDEYDPEEDETARKGTASYGTPVIDGQVDEIWEDAETLSIDRYQQAWDVATGTAKVLWDDDNLYVLVHVSDSELDKSNTTDKHEQDSIEVFLDENNGKTSFYEKDDEIG